MPVLLPAATPRLRFREMMQADLYEVTALLSAPDPARPHRRTRTRADAERWIAWTVQNYATHGFGLWVIETHDGVFIGDCGLTVQTVEGEDTIEVGYHVHLAYRRRGLAGEAAGSVRDLARAMGVRDLVAIIRPDNLPSQRVAAKVGLHPIRRVVKNGADALVFAATLNPPSDVEP